jgi:XTP/dITP diphosphohydrolase
LNRVVLFATSNAGKLREARSILAPYGLEVESVDAKGTEIQADTTPEVEASSAEAAAARLGKPVLVEDAGLFVDSLHGFPGVYSAYAFKTIGIPGLLALLEGTSKRAAHFSSAVAYCEPSGEPRVFEGRAVGRIAQAPAGKNGFGFDPVFIAKGGRMTFAELTTEAKSRLSHRGEAMRKFAAWYTAKARE